MPQKNNSHDPIHVNAVFETAKIAVASAIVINGSAALVMLNFVSDMKKSGQSVGCALGTALILFAFGVLCAGLATTAAYITNYIYTYINNESKVGISFHILGMMLVVLAYVLFSAGVIFSYFWFIRN